MKKPGSKFCNPGGGGEVVVIQAFKLKCIYCAELQSVYPFIYNTTLLLIFVCDGEMHSV